MCVGHKQGMNLYELSTLSYHVHDPNFLASLIVLACCDMVKCLRGDTGGSTSPAD